jgi:hypothetical protein
VSISSDDDTDSTELDGEYHSVLNPDVDMRMEDDVDAQDGVDLDGEVDMDRNGVDEEEEDENKEDEEEEWWMRMRRGIRMRMMAKNLGRLARERW